MFTRINRTNKGVTGLADTPNLSTSDMQEKFDELGALAVDGANGLMDELEESGASSIGAYPPTGYEGDENVQAILDAHGEELTDCKAKKHTHANKSILDTITEGFVGSISYLATLLANITRISQSVSDKNDEIPTSHAIVSFVQNMGGGDMTRARYDSDNDGVVDNAENAREAVHAEYATAAESATNATNAVNATNAASATMANDALTMGGNQLSFEDGHFFIQNGNVKKKLGSGGDLVLVKSLSGRDGASQRFDMNGIVDDYQDLTAEDFVLVVTEYYMDIPSMTIFTDYFTETVRGAQGIANTWGNGLVVDPKVTYDGRYVTVNGLAGTADAYIGAQVVGVINGNGVGKRKTSALNLEIKLYADLYVKQGE